MIKHSASEQNQLPRAAERAARAIEQILYGTTFTFEQQRWLGRIETQRWQHSLAPLAPEERRGERLSLLLEVCRLNKPLVAIFGFQSPARHF